MTELSCFSCFLSSGVWRKMSFARGIFSAPFCATQTYAPPCMADRRQRISNVYTRDIACCLLRAPGRNLWIQAFGYK